MTILMILGAIVIMIGLVGDTIAANRKILEDIQYRVRALEVKENPREDEFKL